MVREVCSHVFIGTNGEVYSRYCAHPGLSKINRFLAQLDPAFRLFSRNPSAPLLRVIPSGVDEETIRTDGICRARVVCKPGAGGEGGCDQFGKMTPEILERQRQLMQKGKK